MSKLDRQLSDWTGHGLITRDQATLIRKHESEKPESSWILSGLYLLGALIVAIGVISLIAANWFRIPDAVKLGADFLLLLGLGFATLRSQDSNKLLAFEGFLLSFILMCLASIGLISQVFHTGGKLHEALLFWSLITFAAASAARNILIPFLWTGAFLTGISLAALESIALQPIFHRSFQAVFMAIPLLCAVLTIISKNFGEESASTRAFRAWTILGGITALAVAEVTELHRDFTSAYFPAYALWSLALWGVWKASGYTRIQKGLVSGVLFTFLSSFHLPFLGVSLPVVYASHTVLELGLMAVFVASLKERALFQGFLTLLGLRFLTLYFQAFGGLARTGFGLILSGALVIGMGILWNRYRKAIADWVERWAQ
jgi:uncharacterized membrane protein